MQIKINKISKTFKNGTKALDEIDLKIENGIFGLLGQNGAGKTTLMRILTTIYDASEGTLSMDKTDYCKTNYSKIKQKIGYLPQELGMYPNLSVRESLEYIGALSDIPSHTLKTRIKNLLEQTNMEEYQKMKNRQLSGGMKRRVGLVQAMLTDPELLVIDEPTAGVDPEERIKIRKMLSEFGKDRTVIFSTHVVEDLVSISNKLCVLSKGKVRYLGSVTDMIKIADKHCFTCDIRPEDDGKLDDSGVYIVNKNYTESGIKVKFISQDKPEFNCAYITPGLEDAYIYINHF